MAQKFPLKEEINFFQVKNHKKKSRNVVKSSPHYSQHALESLVPFLQNILPRLSLLEPQAPHSSEKYYPFTKVSYFKKFPHTVFQTGKSNRF